MDVRKLEAFCKVFECKSFSRAGDLLHLSQPTVSSHVASLEEELSTPLFDRLGRTILPTMAGEILYRHSLEAFSCLEKAKTEIALLNSRIFGRLTFGASTIPANYILPCFLPVYTAVCPDVTISITVGDSTEIAAKVSEGLFSLGVVGANLKEDFHDLEFIHMLEDELAVLCSPDLLAKVEKEETQGISLARLITWPWVCREPGSGTRLAFDKYLSGMGVNPKQMNIILEMDDAQAVIECTRAGLGFSVTSVLAARSFLDSGQLVRLDIGDLKATRNFYCILNSRRYVYPAARKFVDLIKDASLKGFFNE